MQKKLCDLTEYATVMKRELALSEGSEAVKAPCSSHFSEVGILSLASVVRRQQLYSVTVQL